MFRIGDYVKVHEGVRFCLPPSRVDVNVPNNPYRVTAYSIENGELYYGLSIPGYEGWWINAIHLELCPQGAFYVVARKQGECVRWWSSKIILDYHEALAELHIANTTGEYFGQYYILQALCKEECN
jgi:hypothetical protein